MNSGYTDLSKLRWHKSSYSSGNGGNCIEVAETPTTVLVRDTQHRNLGYLVFPLTEWTLFLRNLENGFC